MRNRLQLLMDRSSYFILKNRWITACTFSVLLLFGGLYALNLIITPVSDNFKPESSVITINLASPMPVKTKPVTEFPKETEVPVVPKKEIITVKEPVKSAEPDTPVVNEVANQPEPEMIREIPAISEETETRANDTNISKNRETTDRDKLNSLPVPAEDPPDSGYSDFDELSKGLNLPQPTYPRSAVKWKKEGSVTLEITINPDGSVKEVNLLESSGHKILDKECIKTVRKKWSFNKNSAEIKTIKKFTFRLL